MRSSWPRWIAISLIGCGAAGSPKKAVPTVDASGATGDSSLGGSGADASMNAAGGSAALGAGPCGLASPAFCETFAAPPSSPLGRMGELSPARWSAGRVQPNLPTGAGAAMPIGPATLPTSPGCRAGLPAVVYPDQDALICDPNASIASKHLLVAVAAQNYGQNSYRIRQPFDFAGRVGTIVFDADSGLVPGIGPPGWIALDITEDPVGVPSFQILINEEGGSLPNNGFELQFNNACAGGEPKQLTVGKLHVFQNYVDTQLSPMNMPCVSIQLGYMNRYQVLVSQQQIQVFMTPFSADGTHFDAPELVFSGTVDLPFTRGYVHLTTHNHATIKYAMGMDAAFSRWGNIGFDGPIFANWREYDAPDTLTPKADAQGRAGYNIGYVVPDVSKGTTVTAPFSGVDPTGAASARISLTAWYLNSGGGPLSMYTLSYRLNGNTWHNRLFSPGEISALGGTSLGTIDQMLDVLVSELVAGSNTVEFTTTNVPTSYPAVVQNVTLVVATQ